MTTESTNTKPSGKVAGLLEFFAGPGVGLAYLGHIRLAAVWFLASVALLVALPWLATGYLLILLLRIASTVFATRMARRRTSEVAGARVVSGAFKRRLVVAGLAVVSVALIYVVRATWAGAFKIGDSGSAPALIAGDSVNVHKGAYWFAEPAHGDIVVFLDPCRFQTFVQRVVAVAGDTVAFRCNRLFLNGRAALVSPLEEPFEFFYADPQHAEGGEVRSVPVAVETLQGRSYRIVDEPYNGVDPALEGLPVVSP